MNVCFELSATYPIGPTPVCLKGGTFSAEGLSICGPSYCSPGKCETYTYQTATVCVPVTVTPTAIPGTTRTICCGDPVINPGAVTCPSTARHCHFTVSQKVCIEVPIAFGASAQVGEPRIECETPSGEGCVGCN